MITYDQLSSPRNRKKLSPQSGEELVTAASDLDVLRDPTPYQSTDVVAAALAGLSFVVDSQKFLGEATGLIKMLSGSGVVDGAWNPGSRAAPKPGQISANAPVAGDYEITSAIAALVERAK
jgi:hypothetical protein